MLVAHTCFQHCYPPPMTPSYKLPQSVLVVIHTSQMQVLLLRRADMGSWQSVTGSKDHSQESYAQTAAREVAEETGLDVNAPACVLWDWDLENIYDIYPQYWPRYAPGVRRNTEHVFGLQVPADSPIVLSPSEHTEYRWLPWLAAADEVFSPSNAEAILMLPRQIAQRTAPPPATEGAT
jgi:dATP pyrophosphohydrolase